ncbi:homeobox-leucine zipper protein ROC8-like isoform X2 [Euphorbia lathyris]|uniref:homeobox-leucine zipper protein ROC8-like isoform X2 n=1 Tax=Euphorbia lathyris TaxID=212925 RepID=UPI0033139973
MAPHVSLATINPKGMEMGGSASGSGGGGKKPYHRHTNHQTQLLEAFFKDCPHPDENQRRQLSNDLNLEPKQVKFWFQNKRTQTKSQSDRADNSVLRSENERMQCENMAIMEALKNVICPACGGPPCGKDERQRSLQKLQMENAKLKEEHEKVSALLSGFIGKPISPVDQLIRPIHGASMDIMAADAPNQRLGCPALGLDLNAGLSDGISLPVQHIGIPEMDKALMSETATGACDELLKLMRIHFPLWTQTNPDGRLTIHRHSYDKLFPRPYHFNTSNARIESSKSSGTVPLDALTLVEMFLDPSKWADLYPTVVTKARLIQVVETGALGNPNGALLLMYEQQHILSPLVPPREFYFLRLCQQAERGSWVIADISYDCFQETNLPSRAWKLPSGCMIQEMPNGCSKVTWVEHVEVDDKIQTHRLYRDLICGKAAYGAERWIVTLERMCERLAFSFLETSPTTEIGVVSSPQGKRSIMKLSQRMVRDFCAMLSMSGKLDFPQMSEANNSGVRVSVRRSCESGQPVGIIVSAATSLWLPLPPLSVFSFFKDEKTRIQWDILSNGNPVHELAHISIGAHQGNRISIIRAMEPYIPTENNMVMLQESCTDDLGSLVVYAPVGLPTMQLLLTGDQDPSIIPILPSGFVISGDGRPQLRNGSGALRQGGSLLTVALQMLVPAPSCSSSSESEDLNMESIATVNTLISSTVQKIKVALNCSDLD